MLAALEMGIATCWLGSINRKKIKELLKIPEDREVDTIIALGYPMERSVIEDGREDVKYWKDENGVMHVPKKGVEKLLHINGW